MDRYLSIEAFVRVAESQSFARAARQLGVSKSVITSRIHQLEAFVAAPLFHRTTRSVRLSETGESFLHECADWVRRTGTLVDDMRQVAGSPSGVLRVHALPGFALGHFGKLLRELQDRHPGIVLDLVISDTIVDPVREGFDCVLQIFEPISGSLVARRLFSWRPVFCASPAYLKKHGEPRAPADLRAHRLGLYSRYPTRDRWVFSGKKKQTTLVLDPFLRTNSVHLLHDYALADAGIVCIPTLVAAESLMAGRLRALLPDERLDSFWLCAVYPSTESGATKLKLFLEALAVAKPDDPPWDRALIARRLIPPLA